MDDKLISLSQLVMSLDNTKKEAYIYSGAFSWLQRSPIFHRGHYPDATVGDGGCESTVFRPHSLW
jgi:hypothetical protein